jgi:hypothetical protein
MKKITSTNEITVTQTSTGRYINVEFFVVRKGDKVAGMIVKKTESTEWLVSRQSSPKFSQSRGFNAKLNTKEEAVEKLVSLYESHCAMCEAIANGLTGKGPTELFGGKVSIIR